MPHLFFRQKIRIGASALVSALHALPWEGSDEEGSSSEDEEAASTQRMGVSAMHDRRSRPQCELFLLENVSESRRGGMRTARHFKRGVDTSMKQG
jgi:hypothetical protein